MKRLIPLWLFVLCGALGCDGSSKSRSTEERNEVKATRFTERAPTKTTGIPPSFEEWMEACRKLPSNLQSGFRLPPKDVLPLKDFAQLSGVIDAFFGWCTNGVMSRPGRWLGEQPKRDEFFNTRRVYFEPPAIPFQPFVQKLTVPAGSEIVFHGDFHGDIHSLARMLDWCNGEGYLSGFKIARPNVYFVFLGDYTDRGIYGAEVIYTLLRLKNANPDHVWMVRGNHEDIGLTSRYGFLQEFVAKFGRDPEAIRKLSRIYDFMPVALYAGLGDDFIQCNHGGLEPGYEPSPLLASERDVQFEFLGVLRQAQFIQEHSELLRNVDPVKRNQLKHRFADFLPQSPTAPAVLGFMWNDFAILGDEATIDYDAGRAWVFGREFASAVLGAAPKNGKRIRAVFRAHQHSGFLNPMMRRLRASNGLFRHWQDGDSRQLLHAENQPLQAVLDHREVRGIPDGSVWTFNVAPDSVYGKNCEFAFDCFGILSVQERFVDWTVRVVNQTGEQ